jgi:hypothetical protein
VERDNRRAKFDVKGQVVVVLLTYCSIFGEYKL